MCCRRFGSYSSKERQRRLLGIRVKQKALSPWQSLDALLELQAVLQA
jgi:hypothetical protein